MVFFFDFAREEGSEGGGFGGSRLRAPLELITRSLTLTHPFTHSLSPARSLAHSRPCPATARYIRRACRLLSTELAQLKRHPTVLIFPEGTDLSESNVAKGHAYSELRSLPKCVIVLLGK